MINLKKAVCGLLIATISCTSLVSPVYAKSAKAEAKEEHSKKVTEEITFKTTDSNFKTDEFADTIEKDGWVYSLSGIKYSEVSKGDYIIEKDVVLNDPVKSKYQVGDTFEVNGKNYTVKAVESFETTITDRVEDLSWEIRLGAFENKPTAPETLTTTYSDVYTGKVLNVTARLESVFSPDPSWRNDLEIPITVYGMDGVYYTIGDDVKVKADPYHEETALKNMLAVQDKIVENADLNSKTNEITSIEWSSGIYEHESLKDAEGNPVLCRNAIATGRTLKADYTAKYVADSVALPNCKGYSYTITYDELQEGETEYTVKAIATYTPQVDNSVWFFDSPTEAILAGVGLLLFIIIAVLVAFILTRKKRNNDDDDDDYDDYEQDEGTSGEIDAR